jgi:hypothetical protein
VTRDEWKTFLSTFDVARVNLLKALCALDEEFTKKYDRWLPPPDSVEVDYCSAELRWGHFEAMRFKFRDDGKFSWRMTDGMMSVAGGDLDHAMSSLNRNTRISRAEILQKTFGGNSLEDIIEQNANIFGDATPEEIEQFDRQDQIIKDMTAFILNLYPE